MKNSFITSFMKNFVLVFLPAVVTALNVFGQNVGINTTNPQATLDVKGNQRFGGANHYTAFDSASGKITWNGSNLFAPSAQYLIRHSASAEGLYYRGDQLEYRDSTGNPRFYTNWITGDGYFSGKLGIGNTYPNFPLSFSDALGEKIGLWGQWGSTYGIGIQPYKLQIHTDVVQADIILGYGSSESMIETFRFRGNGAFSVRGNYGTPGQVLMSNGDQSPTWTNLGPNYFFFRQTGSSIDVSDNTVNVSGVNGQTFTTDSKCNLIVTVSAEIQMPPGEPEQSVLVYTDIKNSSGKVIGSSTDYVLMKPTKDHSVKRNATSTIFIGSQGNALAPGTYSLACSVQRVNDTNSGNSTCTNTQVIVQAVRQ